MKAQIDVEKFSTPNYIILNVPVQISGVREFHEQPKIHLKDADVELLDYLCNEFRKDIFEKAGQQDPKKYCK